MMFYSNPDMIRQHFDELMSDGEEHSIREIAQYIREATGNHSIEGGKLTDSMINSTVHKMLGKDSPDFVRTRRGYYQKIKMAQAETFDMKILLHKTRDILDETLNKLNKVYTINISTPGLVDVFSMLKENGHQVREYIRDAIAYVDSELELLSPADCPEEDKDQSCYPTLGM